MRRGLIGSVCFLVLSCGLLFGDPPARDGTANGQVYWLNEGQQNASPTVDNQKGTLKGEGTAAVDIGWSLDSVTMLVMKVGGGEVYSAGASGGTSGWSASLTNLPPANYHAWLVCKISSGSSVQLVTAPLASRTVGNPANPAPRNTGNAIAMAANQPARGVGKTSMNGNGTYGLGAGWSLTGNPSCRLYCFPKNGGRILTSANGATLNDQVNPPTWTDSVTVDANITYNVIAIIGAEKAGETPQNVGTQWYLDK